jgi:NAD(P)H-dependent FMN reductase
VNTTHAQAEGADRQQGSTPTLLFVSPSLKPAPGYTTNSASRWLLEQAAQQLQQAYPGIAMLDLRTHPLPHFQGLKPEEVDDSNTAAAAAAIARSAALLIAVPGYWSGVSASFKNFIELMCGPAYDYTPPVRTLFSGKPVGLVVVGAGQSTRPEHRTVQRRPP